MARGETSEDDRAWALGRTWCEAVATSSFEGGLGGRRGRGTSLCRPWVVDRPAGGTASAAGGESRRRPEAQGQGLAALRSTDALVFAVWTPSPRPALVVALVIST